MINTTNEGSKLYLYSITSVAILGGLLFGYDTAVISGAEKGLEAFFLSASDFQYNKVMHGITSSSALTGCVLGGAFSGIFASRLGRRNSLRLAAVLFFLSALGSYYPEFLFFEYGKPNMDLLVTFNLYRVLGGIGVGLASAVCPMYIAEIAPSNIRGTLVSCNQFAIIFGMLVVYFVNYLIMGDHQNPIILKDAAGVLSVSSESDMWTVFEGWRFMFGSEAFPAAFFGLLLFFVPKTPRYLVLVQQDEKAYSILEKINGKTKAQEILNDIKATAHEKTEKLFTYGVAVIVIGILLSVFQQAIGINAVLYYAPRIFENAGAEGGGMMQTVIMGVVNIIFTLVAIFTVDRFGRKPLPNEIVQMFDEKTYEEFKKDNRTTPTAYALTNSTGVATFIFTYDKWFESNKDRFFTFAVQYGSGTENYEIWSAGRTVRPGSVTQIELKLKPL